MILFDIKALEEKFKNESLSDKDVFKYLLAILILYSLIPYIASNDFTNRWLLAADIAVMLTILIIGVKQTFDINQRGDGKDYFRRYLALSFVILIRLTVLAIIVIVPVALVIYIFTNRLLGNERKGWVDLLMNTIIGVVYYVMLTRSFKRVSQKTT